jgi:hypothetical protein
MLPILSRLIHPPKSFSSTCVHPISAQDPSRDLGLGDSIPSVSDYATKSELKDGVSRHGKL